MKLTFNADRLILNHLDEAFHLGSWCSIQKIYRVIAQTHGSRPGMHTQRW